MLSCTRASINTPVATMGNERLSSLALLHLLRDINVRVEDVVD